MTIVMTAKFMFGICFVATLLYAIYQERMFLSRPHPSKKSEWEAYLLKFNQSSKVLAILEVILVGLGIILNYLETDIPADHTRYEIIRFVAAHVLLWLGWIYIVVRFLFGKERYFWELFILAWFFLGVLNVCTQYQWSLL